MKRFSVVTLALSLSLIFSVDNFFAGSLERKLNPDQPLPIKVEQYGRVSFAKEKVYLDQLALSLQRRPEVTSQIIIYGSNKHEDQARAKRVKNYLIRKHRINPKRVIIERQYCLTYFGTDLWIVPLGATRPSLPCDSAGHEN